MNHDFNPIPIVSKPGGNVDEGSLLGWLNRSRPGLLEQPGKVHEVRCRIENDEGYFVVTPYLTPKRQKFLKVRIHWELMVGEEPCDLWSTLYTTIRQPEDKDNLKQLALAKAQILMLATTYCEHIKAIVDSTHAQHDSVAESRLIFQMMRHFNVETTPTGRVRNFVVTTQGGHQHEAAVSACRIFDVSQINEYESMTLIKNGYQDLLYQALKGEREGRLSRYLVEYYTWCGKRYGLTFEEAYTRLIDILADDHVQRSLTDLKNMEQGLHKVPVSVSHIRKQYDDIITFLHRDKDGVKTEFLIMDECYKHIQQLIDKFDSWREHPDLSLAQTSLLESKIEDLSRGVKQKGMLIGELRRRFNDIEYWAEWFKKQFPTLFRILDKEND